MPYFGFKRIDPIYNKKFLQFNKIKIYECHKSCWNKDAKYLDKNMIRTQIPGNEQFTNKALLAKNI